MKQGINERIEKSQVRLMLENCVPYYHEIILILSKALIFGDKKGLENSEELIELVVESINGDHKVFKEK